MPQNKNKRRDPFHTFIGEPGYRTRLGRSGLDPIDTAGEEARMEGKFYRRLFTLTLRTNNPFYLALMLVSGSAILAFGIPFVIFFVSRLPYLHWEFLPRLILIVPVLLVFGFPFVVGFFLLINFALNIMHRPASDPEMEGEEHQHHKERKKKLPKRRKDYR